MKKENHAKLRHALDNTSKLLEASNLSAEERKELETLRDQMAGSLASSWLPVGVGRKIIMLVFIVLSVKFFMESSYLLAIGMCLLAGFFSPRFVGEAVSLAGRIVGSFER